MDSTNNEINKSKKATNPYLVITIVLLIIVIVSSGLLWFLTNDLSNKISDNNIKIADYSKQINDLKTDTKILSYDIVTNNKAEIQKNIVASKAQKYIDDIISLGKKYSIMFNGFTFDWEKIDTSASTADKWTKNDSMQLVSTFIGDFREGKNAPYILDPITNIWWDVLKRTFTVSLKTK